MLPRICLLLAIVHANKDNEIEDSLEWMQVQDDINKIEVPEYEMDLDARLKANDQDTKHKYSDNESPFYESHEKEEEMEDADAKHDNLSKQGEEPGLEDEDVFDEPEENVDDDDFEPLTEMVKERQIFPSKEYFNFLGRKYYWRDLLPWQRKGVTKFPPHMKGFNQLPKGAKGVPKVPPGVKGIKGPPGVKGVEGVLPPATKEPGNLKPVPKLEYLGSSKGIPEELLYSTRVPKVLGTEDAKGAFQQGMPIFKYASQHRNFTAESIRPLPGLCHITAKRDCIPSQNCAQLLQSIRCCNHHSWNCQTIEMWRELVEYQATLSKMLANQCGQTYKAISCFMMIEWARGNASITCTIAEITRQVVYSGRNCDAMDKCGKLFYTQKCIEMQEGCCQLVGANLLQNISVWQDSECQRFGQFGEFIQSKRPLTTGAFIPTGFK